MTRESVAIDTGPGGNDAAARLVRPQAPPGTPPSSTANGQTNPYCSPRSSKPGLPAAKPPGCEATGP
jgi:hypothetical protein